SSATLKNTSEIQRQNLRLGDFQYLPTGQKIGIFQSIATSGFAASFNIRYVVKFTIASAVSSSIRLLRSHTCVSHYFCYFFHLKT
ncbi:hypothetical protein HMI54_010240, partial [Coelomomyces lativittatus]